MSALLERVESKSIAPAMENGGNVLPRGATHCTGIHARAARGIWPKKTAENWAEAAGVKPRIAKYWIAGSHPVSDAGRNALVRLLV